MSDGPSPWNVTNGFDRRALSLANRHYPRQKPGTRQFIAPARRVVLLTASADALWVSILQKPEYTKHDWPGAWVCSLFRNEGPLLSSTLIVAAVAATRHEWGDPPSAGMITFVNTSKIRRKRDPGRCFRRAGFVPVGWTKERRHLVLLLSPERTPDAAPAGEWLPLFLSSGNDHG